MKYYSEKTNKTYDSEKECLAAEKEYNLRIERAKAAEEAKANERAQRAKKIEDLYKKVVEARREYNAELEAFIKDYGSFHTTFKTVEPFFSFFDLF